MADIYIIKESVKDGNGKRAYRITNLDNFRWDVRTPVSPMPLPEEAHDENVLVKMEGNSAMIDVSWRLLEGQQNFGSWVNGTQTFTPDPSLGTSAIAQIDEWRENFIPKSVKDRYSVVIPDSNTLEDIGTLGGINFNISGDSPVVWSAMLQFFVGTVYTIFEADVPERPSSVTISTSGSSSDPRIVVGWSESTSYADANDKPPTTGVSIKYKKDGGVWREANSENTGDYAVGNGGESGAPAADSTTNSFTITKTNSGTDNITSGVKYRVKVAILSADSDEAFIKHYRNGKTSSTNSMFVTLP